VDLDPSFHFDAGSGSYFSLRVDPDPTSIVDPDPVLYPSFLAHNFFIINNFF
jgi:hypothetical protein